MMSPFRFRHRSPRFVTAISLSLFASTITLTGAARAQTLGSPSVYYTTDAAQTYVVPSGVNLLQVELWGAGGGGYYNCSGGYGAFAGGNLTVTPGMTLTLIVGDGGNQGGYGGGGTGSFNGGGRSAIDMLVGGVNTEVITAGGGGGAAFSSLPSPPNFIRASGGTAGGTVGYSGNGFAPGAGGNQSAGGAAGGSGATAGSQFQGGMGAFSFSGYGGGGGGGGYFGGGGGVGSPFVGAGGGGGSSYIGSPFLNGTGIADTIGNASFGNSTSDYNLYSLGGMTGRGGSASGFSGGGLVVIRTITGSAAPEPSSLVLLGGIGLPAFPLIASVRRRSQRRTKAV